MISEVTKQTNLYGNQYLSNRIDKKATSYETVNCLMMAWREATTIFFLWISFSGENNKMQWLGREISQSHDKPEIYNKRKLTTTTKKVE